MLKLITRLSEYYRVSDVRNYQVLGLMERKFKVQFEEIEGDFGYEAYINSIFAKHLKKNRNLKIRNYASFVAV